MVPSKRENVSKRSIQVVLGISIALVLFTVVGGLSVSASSDDGAYRQLSVYSEVLSRINSEYVEQPNMTAVTDGALHGLLESLDANSSYLTPAEYKDYREHKTLGKTNINAVVSKRYGYAAVVSVIPGGQSPAELRQNLGSLRHDIPGALWGELKQAGLVRADAPVPTDP